MRRPQWRLVGLASPPVCRLFALHAGPHDVPAEFWLLHAPDSFAAQSEHNADGFGIATLSTRDGQLLVRNPIKAADDQTYRQVSQRARASQFLAHLRYASTGEVSLANTHPFLMDNRAFAHNGVVADLPEVERRLGTSLAMVGGTTDTERFFALLTIRIREAGQDVRAGIVAAVHELARDIELYSLNFFSANPAICGPSATPSTTRCGCCTASRTVTHWCRTTSRAPCTCTPRPRSHTRSS